MNAPQKIMSVRRERAKELHEFATLLTNQGVLNGDTSALYRSIALLRDNTKGFHTEGTADNKCWGYQIDNLELSLPHIPPHTRPRSVDRVKIVMDSTILCNPDDWDKRDDPFLKQYFRVRVIGLNSTEKIYSFGFRVERHCKEVEAGEIHPCYHFQYDPLVERDEELGTVLKLDAPRMMHAPLDFILGVDLVLSNFAPEQWYKLREDGQYLRLCRDYQGHLWRPYIHSLASHWSSGGVNWHPPSLICPYLVS